MAEGYAFSPSARSLLISSGVYSLPSNSKRCFCRSNIIVGSRHLQNHKQSFLISRDMSTLSVKSIPVPNPCGSGLLKVAHHCAMAFRPIFDSKAEVIHQPIFRFSASANPFFSPCKPTMKGRFENNVLRTDG